MEICTSIYIYMNICVCVFAGERSKISTKKFIPMDIYMYKNLSHKYIYMYMYQYICVYMYIST